MKTTEVIFRVERDGGILAIFPYNSYKRSYRVECYSHKGQHSEMSWNYYGDTKPASLGQYADLKAELEALGYNLKVLQKVCYRKMYQL